MHLLYSNLKKRGVGGVSTVFIFFLRFHFHSFLPRYSTPSGLSATWLKKHLHISSPPRHTWTARSLFSDYEGTQHVSLMVNTNYGSFP